MTTPRAAVGPIQAVIFDMDGLLLDTEGIYTEVTQIIAERYGRTYDWSIKQHTLVAAPWTSPNFWSRRWNCRSPRRNSWLSANRY